jgi:hypothetical protein
LSEFLCFNSVSIRYCRRVEIHENTLTSQVLKKWLAAFDGRMTAVGQCCFRTMWHAMLICSSVWYYTWRRSLSAPGMSPSKWTYLPPDVSCVLAYAFRVTSHWSYRNLCVLYWNCKIELLFGAINLRTPIPLAAPSQACVCGCSLAGIAGSNPAGCMGICLLWVLFIVR